MDLNFENDVKDLDGKTFFFQKRYIPETARFEDPVPDIKNLHKRNSYRFCSACARLNTLEQFNTPKVYKINIVMVILFIL